MCTERVTICKALIIPSSVIMTYISDLGVNQRYVDPGVAEQGPIPRGNVEEFLVEFVVEKVGADVALTVTSPQD